MKQIITIPKKTIKTDGCIELTEQVVCATYFSKGVFTTVTKVKETTQQYLKQVTHSYEIINEKITAR